MYRSEDDVTTDSPVPTSSRTAAAPLLSVLMDGAPAADTFQAGQLLRGNFLRANVPPPPQIALDDYHAVLRMVRSTAT
jgi:hypothetical protein